MILGPVSRGDAPSGCRWQPRDNGREVVRENGEPRGHSLERETGHPSHFEKQSSVTASDQKELTRNLFTVRLLV